MRVDINLTEERSVFGCVIFDDVNEPSSGWASKKGRFAKRIRTIGDLDSDVVWVSNLNWQQLFQNNLHRNPKIKRENFFRLEMLQLASELGLKPSEQPKKAVEVMSEIFDRTMMFSENYYGRLPIRDSLKNTIDSYFFNDEVKELMRMPESIRNFMEQAFLAYQGCFGKKPENAIIAKFRYSRSNYADNLLKFPYPVGDWTLYKGKIPTNQGEQDYCDKGPVYAFLAELCDSQPALCEITVNSVHVEYADLLDFGNGSEKRNWVPIHEAAHLAAFSNVIIKRILVAESYQSLEFIDRYTPPHSGVCGDISASLGIIAENHWVTLASKRMMKYGNTKISVTPPRAVWYRAWDRMISMKAAVIFKRYGFHVYSYGLGGVNLAIEKDQIGEALVLAEKLEMTAPMWVKEMESLDDPSSSSGSCKLENKIEFYSHD